MRSQPASAKARATSTASSPVRPPSAQSVAEMRTDIGLSSGQAARMAREHLERKAHAVLERAAILVGALVGQRRDEARQQIAVRARAARPCRSRRGRRAGSPRRSRRSTASMSARRHLARHLAVREIGQRRRRDDRPGALLQRLGPCPPTSAWSRPCGRHGRAAGRTSSADCACTKSTMRVQAASLRVVLHAGAARA